VPGGLEFALLMQELSRSENAAGMVHAETPVRYRSRLSRLRSRQHPARSESVTKVRSAKIAGLRSHSVLQFAMRAVISRSRLICLDPPRLTGPKQVVLSDRTRDHLDSPGQQSTSAMQIVR